MTEEEKKAIKTAKCIRAGIPVGTCNDDYIILLNLIERQQKEIEVLREENFDTIYMKAVADFKDKIREKIKILKNESRKNNENIDYTRKLVYTADETIKKEIQNLEKLLEE